MVSSVCREDNLAGIRGHATGPKKQSIPTITVSSHVVADSASVVIMDNIRNQVLGRIPTFVLSALLAVSISFDICCFNYYVEERFTGPLLLISTCLFNFGVLIGAITVWVLSDRFSLWATVFFLSLCKVVLHFTLKLTLPNPVIITVLSAEGLLLGWTQSVVYYQAFTKVPAISKRLLLAIIFLGFGLGQLIGTLFVVENDHISVTINKNVTELSFYKSVYNTAGALQPMSISFRISFENICFGSAVVQCLISYLIYDVWKTPECTNTFTVTRLQHDVLVEQPSNDSSNVVKKLIYIGWLLGFLSSSLIAGVPHYLFGFSNATYHVYLLYICMFGYVLGRILFLVYGNKFPPTFWLILSMVITGASTCGLTFNEFQMASVLFHGLGVSLIFPAYSFFLLRIHGTSIHSLIMSSVVAQFTYPILLTQMLSAYGAELYSASNFGLLLGLMVVFVYLLNVMSSMASPSDPVQQRVWRFFRGEGLKRTTSIRKFISSVRGSIRGSRYGRLRISKSPGVEAATPLGPNPIAVNSYRSTDSSAKKNRSRYVLKRKEFESAITLDINQTSEAPVSDVKLPEKNDPIH
ncbi:unnamed protein product [Bursaphelenchus okinawaensis]|uniref:MFS domain-containing protein n=1 Tax=Bursaphelenchus okinawaensis TaxID=465554 RepID=A0A811KUL1_9BILA|nr:unnamed protein product [Bursaphelenchus okinawaensis]CAG9112555.1 unnamed protein product [Bursaphelenchus okinawaensis]